MILLPRRVRLEAFWVGKKIIPSLCGIYGDISSFSHEAKSGSDLEPSRLLVTGILGRSALNCFVMPIS